MHMWTGSPPAALTTYWWIYTAVPHLLPQGFPQQLPAFGTRISQSRVRLVWIALTLTAAVSSWSPLLWYSGQAVYATNPYCCQSKNTTDADCLELALFENNSLSSWSFLAFISDAGYCAHSIVAYVALSSIVPRCRLSYLTNVGRRSFVIYATHGAFMSDRVWLDIFTARVSSAAMVTEVVKCVLIACLISQAAELLIRGRREAGPALSRASARLVSHLMSTELGRTLVLHGTTASRALRSRAAAWLAGASTRLPLVQAMQKAGPSVLSVRGSWSGGRLSSTSIRLSWWSCGVLLVLISLFRPPRVNVCYHNCRRHITSMLGRAPQRTNSSLTLGSIQHLFTDEFAQRKPETDVEALAAERAAKLQGYQLPTAMPGPILAMPVLLFLNIVCYIGWRRYRQWAKRRCSSKNFGRARVSPQVEPLLVTGDSQSVSQSDLTPGKGHKAH